MPLGVAGAPRARAPLPGADRRRGDQPQLRPADPLPAGTESDDVYEPGVFYCKDAFEGLAQDGPADRRRGARGACRQDPRRGAPALRDKPAAGADDAARRPTTAGPLGRADRHAGARAAVLGRARARRRRSTRSTPTSTPTCCSSSTGAGAASRARPGASLLARGLPAAAGADVARAGLPAPARAARLLPLQLRGQRADRAGIPSDRRDRSSSGSSSPASPSTTASAWPTSTGRWAPASPTSSRSRRSPPATRSPS